MSIARSEHPAVAANDAIYVFGGLISTAQGTAVTSSVERFLIEEDRWEAVTDMPEARHHGMAATISGLIYLMGGFDAGGFNPVASAWEFDPSSGVWSDINEMPAAQGAGAAVALNDLIYVAGGVPDGTSFFAYDTRSKTWQTLPAMSHPREHVAAVAFEGKVWVLAGRWEGEMLATVETFDPSSGTWSAGPT